MIKQIPENLIVQKDLKDSIKHSDNKEIDLWILLELGSIGARDAATSLSDVIQQPSPVPGPPYLFSG